MIGENIKRLMKENGYTQKQLAIRAKCTESAISRYINNKREPSFEIIKRLSIALGVKADELFNDNQNPKKTNFDRITESVGAFADWIFKSYTNAPESVPCTVENCETTNRIDCKKCFKEWLQKECEE